MFYILFPCVNMCSEQNNIPWITWMVLIVMQNLLLIYGLLLLFLMCEMVSNFPIKLHVRDLFIWPQIEIISNIVYWWFIPSYAYRCCSNPNLYVAMNYRSHSSVIGTNTYKRCHSHKYPLQVCNGYSKVLPTHI